MWGPRGRIDLSQLIHINNHIKILRKLAAPWLYIIDIFTNQSNIAVVFRVSIVIIVSRVVLHPLNARFNIHILRLSFEMEFSNSFSFYRWNTYVKALDIFNMNIAFSFNHVPFFFFTVNR